MSNSSEQQERQANPTAGMWSGWGDRGSPPSDDLRPAVSPFLGQQQTVPAVSVHQSIGSLGLPVVDERFQMAFSHHHGNAGVSYGRPFDQGQSLLTYETGQDIPPWLHQQQQFHSNRSSYYSGGGGSYLPGANQQVGFGGSYRNSSPVNQLVQPAPGPNPVRRMQISPGQGRPVTTPGVGFASETGSRDGVQQTLPEGRTQNLTVPSYSNFGNSTRFAGGYGGYAQQTVNLANQRQQDRTINDRYDPNHWQLNQNQQMSLRPPSNYTFAQGARLPTLVSYGIPQGREQSGFPPYGMHSRADTRAPYPPGAPRPAGVPCPPRGLRSLGVAGPLGALRLGVPGAPVTVTAPIVLQQPPKPKPSLHFSGPPKILEVTEPAEVVILSDSDGEGDCKEAEATDKATNIFANDKDSGENDSSDLEDEDDNGQNTEQEKQMDKTKITLQWKGQERKKMLKELLFDDTIVTFRVAETHDTDSDTESGPATTKRLKLNYALPPDSKTGRMLMFCCSEEQDSVRGSSGAGEAVEILTASQQPSNKVSRLSPNEDMVLKFAADSLELVKAHVEETTSNGTSTSSTSSLIEPEADACSSGSVDYDAEESSTGSSESAADCSTGGSVPSEEDANTNESGAFEEANMDDSVAYQESVEIEENAGGGIFVGEDAAVSNNVFAAVLDNAFAAVLDNAFTAVSENVVVSTAVEENATVSNAVPEKGIVLPTVPENTIVLTTVPENGGVSSAVGEVFVKQEPEDLEFLDLDIPENEYAGHGFAEPACHDEDLINAAPEFCEQPRLEVKNEKDVCLDNDSSGTEFSESPAMRAEGSGNMDLQEPSDAVILLSDKDRETDCRELQLSGKESLLRERSGYAHFRIGYLNKCVAKMKLETPQSSQFLIMGGNSVLEPMDKLAEVLRNTTEISDNVVLKSATEMDDLVDNQGNVLNPNVKYIVFMIDCNGNFDRDDLLKLLTKLKSLYEGAGRVDYLLCRAARQRRRGISWTKLLSKLSEEFNVIFHPFYYDVPRAVYTISEMCVSRFKRLVYT